MLNKKIFIATITCFVTGVVLILTGFFLSNPYIQMLLQGVGAASVMAAATLIIGVQMPIGEMYIKDLLKAKIRLPLLVLSYLSFACVIVARFYEKDNVVGRLAGLFFPVLVVAFVISNIMHYANSEE